MPGPRQVPVFVEVPAPTDEELQTVLHKIITRMTQAAHPSGMLVEEHGQTTMADDSDSDGARVLRPLQAAACTYRIAFGPSAGQKVLAVQGAMLRDADFKQNLCADIDGFSLHAAVRCGANDRHALEQLCRYITRPPCRPRPASGRAPCQTQTVPWTVCVRAWLWPTSACKPTRPGKSSSSSRPLGATAPRTPSLPPLEFMQRLAALVLRLRLHLIRFHGLLAPNAKRRALVVPRDAGSPAQAAPAAAAACAHHRPVRLS